MGHPRVSVYLAHFPSSRLESGELTSSELAVLESDSSSSCQLVVAVLKDSKTTELGEFEQANQTRSIFLKEIEQVLA